jgi:hypothetical protein
MKELSKKITNPTISTVLPKKQCKRTRLIVDKDAVYQEAHGSPSSQSTPMLTRVTQFLKASTNYMTPRTPGLISSPESRRLPRLFTVFLKQSSIQHQLHLSDSDEEESTDQFCEGKNLFGSKHESTSHLEEESINRCFSEADFEADSDYKQDGRHHSTPALSPQYCPRELPMRQAISKQNQDTSFDLDTYIAEEEEVHESKSWRQSNQRIHCVCFVPSLT